MFALEAIRLIAAKEGYDKVGTMIGVSGRTVRRWCNGDYQPSILASEAIKKMLAKRDRTQRT